MSVRTELSDVTLRIIERSKPTRDAYLAKIAAAGEAGPRRAHLSCGNQAHAYAAMGVDKDRLAEHRAPNIGIVTAYNDMLSAHQPYETYPDIIKDAARKNGATAQVAGGVPAMCDGVTQGQPGMELSLFSRDVIALSTGVALSHNTFDAAMYLGVCDKIVPGLVIAAATFGHIPAIFVPAGPMLSGIPNDEKTRVRKAFVAGQVDRETLMAAEMASYHGPGTCTFYGTANTNQMLMEFMGLHLPGASFVNPGDDVRQKLTEEATRRVLGLTALGNSYRGVGEILDEKAFVNGIVGLMATGGSTNLVMHLPAMARAAGVILDAEDFNAISEIVPLMAKVYPNGLADVNHFHAAGGLGYMIKELLNEGLLHPDTKTVAGDDMSEYTKEPTLKDGDLVWTNGTDTSLNTKILRPASDPFQTTGGLKELKGNLGRSVMKVSAVDPAQRKITAPARVFHDQHQVKAAFQAGEFTEDTIVVVRFQGPRSNGMPELHSLTPILSVLIDRGLKVALVTDGRMSGASGKVPAAIHLSPEAVSGGPIAKLRDGDIVEVDAEAGTLTALVDDLDARPAETPDLSANEVGIGRELFAMFRNTCSDAIDGACSVH